MSGPRLVLATRNAHKVGELRAGADWAGIAEKARDAGSCRLSR